MRSFDYTRRHLRVRSSSLLAFAALGLFLESLQGFKVAAYLDVSNETRRLMWRLAHAHSALLGAVNILFALSLKTLAPTAVPGVKRISTALLGATVLIVAAGILSGRRRFLQWGSGRRRRAGAARRHAPSARALLDRARRFQQPMITVVALGDSTTAGTPGFAHPSRRLPAEPATSRASTRTG